MPSHMDVRRAASLRRRSPVEVFLDIGVIVLLRGHNRAAPDRRWHAYTLPGTANIGHEARLKPTDRAPPVSLAPSPVWVSRPISASGPPVDAAPGVWRSDSARPRSLDGRGSKVPEAKGHPIDPTARPAAGGTRDVVTGKWGTDATRPPLSRPEARRVFDRTLAPHRNEVRLEDFLD